MLYYVVILYAYCTRTLTEAKSRGWLKIRQTDRTDQQELLNGNMQALSQIQKPPKHVVIKTRKVNQENIDIIINLFLLCFLQVFSTGH